MNERRSRNRAPVVAALVVVAVAVAPGGVSRALAQGPDECVWFDPENVSGRQVDGVWVIVDGAKEITSVGPKGGDAQRVIDVMRRYAIDQVCTVGVPEPVLEYALAGGEPPLGPMDGEDCLDIDPDALVLREVRASWFIYSGSTSLIGVGRDIAVARQAIGILREHRFTKLCRVFTAPAPVAAWYYFRRDPCAGAAIEEASVGAAEVPINGASVPFDVSFSGDCRADEGVIQVWIEQRGGTRRLAAAVASPCETGTCSIASELRANDQGAAGQGQLRAGSAEAVFELRAGGEVVAERRVEIRLVLAQLEKECVRFDPANVGVLPPSPNDPGWKIASSGAVLERFPQELFSLAVLGRGALEWYNMPTRCAVGPLSTYLGFNGAPPVGPYPPERCTPYVAQRLRTTIVNGVLHLTNLDGSLMVPLGTDTSAAHAALDFARGLDADRFCRFGPMTYFRKTGCRPVPSGEITMFGFRELLPLDPAPIPLRFEFPPPLCDGRPALDFQTWFVQDGERSSTVSATPACVDGSCEVELSLVTDPEGDGAASGLRPGAVELWFAFLADGEPFHELWFEVDVVGAGPTRFVRGDVTLDGKVDVSDVIAILEWLFLGAAAPGCTDAADANDSGTVDLSDAMTILGFLFLGDPAPPAPFPGCGTDPGGADPLDCRDSRSCP